MPCKQMQEKYASRHSHAHTHPWLLIGHRTPTAYVWPGIAHTSAWQMRLLKWLWWREHLGVWATHLWMRQQICGWVALSSHVVVVYVAIAIAVINLSKPRQACKRKCAVEHLLTSPRWANALQGVVTMTSASYERTPMCAYVCTHVHTSARVQVVQLDANCAKITVWHSTNSFNYRVGMTEC